jgi:hypothetical protein
MATPAPGYRTVTPRLVVPDPAATVDLLRAVFGATGIEPPTGTPYGDRRAMVRDQAGNVYQVAHYRPLADPAAGPG